MLTSECNDEDFGDNLQCQEQISLFLEGSLLVPQEPEIPKTSGYIGHRFCDCALCRTLAPGTFWVRNPKNSGTLVETSPFCLSPGLDVGRSQDPGAHLDQAVDCEMCGDDGCFLGTRNPEKCGVHWLRY